MKVYVCDDYEIPRVGIALILEAQKINVVGRGSPVAMMNQVPALKPAVVVIRDSQDHVSAMKTVCRKLPTTAFLMITGSGAVSTMDALAAGVRGVADVSVSVDSLVLAIHTIAGGHVWIDDQSASGMRERITNGPPPDALDGLSDMERKAAELLAQGLSNKEIASRLYVAEKTVKNYISKILLKLDVRNRQQAALIVRGYARESVG